MVRGVIRRWGEEQNIYLKRYNCDELVAYVKEKILGEVED